MRRPHHTTSSRSPLRITLLMGIALTLLAACATVGDDGESSTDTTPATPDDVPDEGPGEDSPDEADIGATDEGQGATADTDEDGDAVENDAPSPEEGPSDPEAGDRPADDLELIEEQREEFLDARSTITSRGRIGSTIDRVAELESEYDATTTEDDRTQLTVPDHVLFDFDSAELRPEAGEALDDIIEVLEGHDDAPAEIRGHTDNIGSESYNQDLSERRAAAVVDYLVDGGIDGARLTASGAGFSEPVADNEHADGSDNPEGRAENRRVEVLIGG